LAFVDYYLPGYKCGGPAVSVSRRARALAGSVEFFVFTRDRDLGDEVAYEHATPDSWNEREEATVFYASPSHLGARDVLRAVREVSPNVIYLNSFFSRFTRAVLCLRRAGLIKDVRIVIAPRGEFSQGALSLKSSKKRAYMNLAGIAGLYRGVDWHATSEDEQARIEALAQGSHCTLEPEIPPQPYSAVPAEKRSGHCRFVFVGRISRMKNLLYFVKALERTTGSAEFVVYGPIEDKNYWNEVQKEASLLPENFVMSYRGPVPQSEVSSILTQGHVFVLPTLGENFCHAIAEALSVGLPCLISDRTPWNEIENQGAGWAVPLEDPDEWVRRLQALIDMEEAEYRVLAMRVRGYYRAMYAESGGQVLSGLLSA
jgi:glycosyltransferase involved in cell wall biosynthesis